MCRNLLASVNTQVTAAVLSMNYSLYLKGFHCMGVSVTEYINMKAVVEDCPLVRAGKVQKSLFPVHIQIQPRLVISKR